MERKKVLVIKENLVLEINQNHLVKEDLDRSSRDGEKKSFGYKGKSSFTKKMTQNQLVSQIIQNTLEKKHLKVHQLVEKKKALVLMERRSLKVEVIRPKSFTFKKHSQKRAKV